jgi:fructose-specific component phosphotransferase system IIB-like protein
MALIGRGANIDARTVMAAYSFTGACHNSRSEIAIALIEGELVIYTGTGMNPEPQLCTGHVITVALIS